MRREREMDPLYGELFLAGERVAPGLYKEVGTCREVWLATEAHLPPSQDGRVACYALVQRRWSQLLERLGDAGAPEEEFVVDW